MIDSRESYREYLEADRVALGRKPTLRNLAFDEIWKFQRLMRRLEYLTNCRKSRFLRLAVGFLYRRQSYKLGFSIPINVFGPGLSIAHYGTIVINQAVRVGANCRIHVGTNIGTEAGQDDAVPVIGDNCYIGPGAKLFGAIRLGDNIAIGANAVVNRGFPDGNCTLGGIPAKVISDKSSAGLLVIAHQPRQKAGSLPAVAEPFPSSLPAH